MKSPTPYEGRKPMLRPKAKNANQWVGSDQQEDFMRRYLNPESETFGYVKKSALAAGYSESYSAHLSKPSNTKLWLAEARDYVKLHPEHLVQALQQEGLDRHNKASDRIRALELLGKMQGVFVDKKIVAHVNIEEALKELK